MSLWENHTNNVVARARAREKLDEEFNAWVQEFDPQVCSCRATICTKSSLLIGSQGSHIRVPEVREAEALGEPQEQRGGQGPGDRREARRGVQRLGAGVRPSGSQGRIQERSKEIQDIQ